MDLLSGTVETKKNFQRITKYTSRTFTILKVYNIPAYCTVAFINNETGLYKCEKFPLSAVVM